MVGKAVVLSPDTQHILEKVGLNIKKARLRRNMKSKHLAEQAGISEDTLSAVEKGMPSVSMGAYAAVLTTLGMEKDLELLASDEEQKRKYREFNLRVRVRAARKVRKEQEKGAD